MLEIKIGEQLAGQKAVEAELNMSRLWRYQWSFHEPQKTNCWEEDAEKKLCCIPQTNHFSHICFYIWCTNHLFPQVVPRCEIIDAANGSTYVPRQCILRLQSHISSSGITTNTGILILYFTTMAKQAEIKINIFLRNWLIESDTRCCNLSNGSTKKTEHFHISISS